MQLALSIRHDQFPVGIFLIGIFGDVGGAQEAAHLTFAAILFEDHQERLVGILLGVFGEVRRFFVDVEFLQDDVDTGHQESAVAARDDRHPGIGIFGHVRIVG